MYAVFFVGGRAARKWRNIYPHGRALGDTNEARFGYTREQKTYEFKSRVSSEFKIAQILLEKGLAVQNDSVLTITPNSTKYGSVDTATLRVIVSSITGKRVYLFQRQFFIKVPGENLPDD